MRKSPDTAPRWRSNRYSASNLTPQSVRNGQANPINDHPVSSRALLLRWTLAMLVFLALLWQFGFVREVEVVTRNASSISQDTADMIKDLTQSQLNVMKRFKLFLPRQQIEAKLAEQGFVGSVNISVSALSPLLKLEVIPRRAAAKLANQNEDQRQLYLTDLGILFDLPANSPQPSSSLPVIQDTTDLPKQSGSIITSPQIMAFVTQFDAELKAQSTKGEYYFRVSSAPREVTLINPQWGYKVQLISDRPAADQIGELDEFQRWAKRRGVNPTTYVDLRVDDTAFYR